MIRNVYVMPDRNDNDSRVNEILMAVSPLASFFQLYVIQNVYGNLGYVKFDFFYVKKKKNNV